MSRVAVVGDDALAVALARQLAVGPADVTLHEPARESESAADDLASLRLLHLERRRIARDNAALRAWEALEEETGVEMLSPLHAVDVGPPATIAALLHATSGLAPARTLYPAEAERQWREIRFAGLVAYQPAACRISLAQARRALLCSALSWGVRVDCGRVTRVRNGRLGDAQVLVDGTWLPYDAVVVVADSTGCSELAGVPTTPDSATVLSVEPIGRIRDWPSVVHHAGLPEDPRGHCLPTCSAELNQGLLDLSLVDDPDGSDAAARLWSYATRWLPGTIINTKRVRSRQRSVPRLDTSRGRLAITPTLGVRDRGLVPLIAAELACDLFNAIQLDEVVPRAS